MVVAVVDAAGTVASVVVVVVVVVVGVGVLVVMFVEFVTSCCYCLCSHTLHNITVIGGGVTMVPV